MYSTDVPLLLLRMSHHKKLGAKLNQVWSISEYREALHMFMSQTRNEVNLMTKVLPAYFLVSHRNKKATGYTIQKPRK